MHVWNKEERIENKERFTTVPYDPRFPNTNQAKRCIVNYIDFWKCAKVKGEEDESCAPFKAVYKELCPFFWVEAWDEQREDGRFHVKAAMTAEPKY